MSTYDAVLRDLESQRTRIDAAIASLRALTPTVTQAPENTNGAAQASATTPKELTPAAVLRYLRSHPGARPTAEITDALPAFAGLNGPRPTRDVCVRNALTALRDRRQVAGDIKRGWWAKV